MNDYKLREAVHSDTAALSALAIRSFGDTFAHLYPVEEFNAYVDSALTPEKFQVDLEDPNKYTVVLVHGESDELCGYAMLHDGNIRTGDTGEAKDYLEVKRLYVDTPYHGKGAAQVLMSHIMEIINEKKRKIVWLGVWENNLRAQKFYKRYGFYEKGEHTFNVGACEDRDVLFELDTSGYGV